MEKHEKMWQDLGLNVQLHKELLASIGHSFEQTVLAQKNRPKGMAYFDQVIHESHGGRVAELLEGKAQGHKIIGTFCIYVPDEIVMAAGAVPLPLCGGTPFSIPYAEGLFPRDICPLVKSTLGLAFSKTCPYAPLKSMAVGETTCDAKKKTWEILAGKVRFHVMEVPQKKTPKGRELWLEAVQQFKTEVEAVTGNKAASPQLAETICIMNAKRRALQRLGDLRRYPRPPISGLDSLVVMQGALNDDNKRFTDKLNELNDELDLRIQQGVSPFLDGIKRIMVSGCPAVMGNWKLHSIIEQAGAAIVADETCTGTRYYNNLVDESATDLDGQLAALAERYMMINCACFTPNQERLDDVLDLVQNCQVNGVVQYVLQYCHGYNIEAIRVEGALKPSSIPSLKIETDYSEEDVGQIRTRVEAFLETLN